MVGPFPWDEDGNHYLLVAMDPFSKWVEIHAMPLLHSWRAAKFLYDDLVAHWGKPCYVWTDNGAEFVGSFAWLCKGLGIIHHHITIGNSKANGQVEWMIRMLKDCIQQPDKGAHNLLDEPFGLGFAPVIYDSEQDDGCHAISFGHGPTTIVTKHGHPRTTVPAQSANSG